MTAQDGYVQNPADVERKIEETKNRIARGVSIITEAEKAAKAARTTFDYEYALAFGRAEGPETSRKYLATAATIELRRTAEALELAFKHAVRTGDALDKELFAWQSILKSVSAMFNAAGVGQR